MGGGHSFNSQIATQDTLLDLRHLDAVAIDAARRVATVGAGIKIRALQHRLLQEGLVVHGFGGGTHHQSVGGAMSTNLHGAMPLLFAQHVESVRLVLPNGTLAVAREGESLMAAVKSGMGLAGGGPNFTETPRGPTRETRGARARLFIHLIANSAHALLLK